MANQPLHSSGERHAGPIRAGMYETDGELFFPATDGWNFGSGTWQFTRGAVGNYFMRRPLGASTDSVVLNLSQAFAKKIGNDPIGGTVLGSPSTLSSMDGEYIAKDPSTGQFGLSGQIARIRGVQITAIDIVYAIGTLALTAHAVVLNRTTYANNAAPVVTAVGGSLTGTLATATQAQPYLTTITPATAFVIGNNLTDVAEWIEIQPNCAATTVYDLYGIFVRFNYNWL